MGITLSIIAQVINIIVFWQTARFFTGKGYALQHFIFWPIIILIASLPITPGGLGVAEVASEKIWAYNQVPFGGTIYLFYRTFLILLSLSQESWHNLRMPS